MKSATLISSSYNQDVFPYSKHLIIAGTILSKRSTVNDVMSGPKTYTVAGNMRPHTKEDRLCEVGENSMDICD